MESNSTGDSIYTEQEIREMQEFLKENPIDHNYDEICHSLYDGWDRKVLHQIAVHSCYDILQELGKLPPGVE